MSLGFPVNNGAQVLRFEPKDTKQATAGAAETHDTSLKLGFNSLTLDELSDELDRRTKETERLQKEVENATREVLERFGCTYDNNRSLGQDDSLGDPYILSSHQQAMPLVCGLDNLNQELAQSDVPSPGDEMLENAVDDYLQQLSDLKLNKPEQETSNPQKAIMNLQTRLHKVQNEKDMLSELRLKDSKKHVDQMEKMSCMLEELQNIKRLGSQSLQETEDEALALNSKVETLQQTPREVYHTLYEKQYGHICSKPMHQSPAVKVYEDLNDTDTVQEKPFLSHKQLGCEDFSGLNEQETLAEKQMSLHRCQISELDWTLPSHKDKMCCLEQQLIEVQTHLFNTQREKDGALHQTKELQTQLEQLKRCYELQQCEVHEEVTVLRGQLEVAREQLNKAEEDKTCLQALLELKVQEGRQSQELLQEKNEELRFRQQEALEHLTKLEETQSQCKTLQAEQEELKLKLNDREKTIDVLRMETESSVQITVQHRHTIDSLHQENSLLSNQLNQHKLEIQQLRAEIDQHKSDLAVVKHERRQLQASLTEKSQRVREDALEKRQLTAQLELLRMQLLTLTNEHKELQQVHSCKNEEHEGVVLKLQSQLRNAHDELDQMRSTLKTLVGADGHGLHVALDMQKEITAKRDQVDSLQGTIQYLKENMDKLHQEKRYQHMEAQRQLRELTFVKEEKRQLINELEALCSNDKQLRGRISELEAILHKMSESFANCQDFTQLQEQEFFRLKLQHALDLKELQGQNLCTAINPPDLYSVAPSTHTNPSSPQHACNTQIKSNRQQKSPARKLRSLVRELQGVISENLSPHTVNNGSASGRSFHGRRSAPEREHTTTHSEKAEEVMSVSRLWPEICSSEPHSHKTAETSATVINKSSSESHAIWSPVKYNSSQQLFSLGRRSPVHSLLTSDPAS
ncbi:coiled-coil domain-containing protein 158-like isoform X2 [Mugil cephalus]|uniref:coiled-coil domain-containing protein 158-like isoform X2 n=1 Tax=Mugil cephalus TaxID=48193 RepID=UPI001FB5EC89|nr:coiled-coil domain-containing protein 158-like isoform X2 [Mugil cephalus]